jgi:hypothetical protein
MVRLGMNTVQRCQTSVHIAQSDLSHFQAGPGSNEAAERNMIDRRLRHGGPGRGVMSGGKSLSNKCDRAM